MDKLKELSRILSLIEEEMNKVKKLANALDATRGEVLDMLASAKLPNGFCIRGEMTRVYLGSKPEIDVLISPFKRRSSYYGADLDFFVFLMDLDALVEDAKKKLRELRELNAVLKEVINAAHDALAPFMVLRRLGA